MPYDRRRDVPPGSRLPRPSQARQHRVTVSGFTRGTRHSRSSWVRTRHLNMWRSGPTHTEPGLGKAANTEWIALSARIVCRAKSRLDNGRASRDSRVLIALATEIAGVRSSELSGGTACRRSWLAFARTLPAAAPLVSYAATTYYHVVCGLAAPTRLEMSAL